MRIVRRLTRFPKDVRYRVGGLPNAVRYALFRRSGGDALDELRRALARRYWSGAAGDRPRARTLALLCWPLVLGVSIFRATSLNGRVVAAGYGRPVAAQVADQLSLYFRHGVLPPTYYIFGFFEADARGRARTYLHRFETKAGALWKLLNGRGTSPLNDKVGFARHCEAHGVRAAPILFVPDASGGSGTPPALPEQDLFLKPLDARGGSGAERWDYAGAGRYRGPEGRELSTSALVEAASRGGKRGPLMIQPRLINHPALADLTTGALITVRILTCLDEKGQPVVIGAALRMAIGKNVTVDNIHAGGIAAAVDLDSGRLAKASDLGVNARLGWMTRHPDTGGQIEGRLLPGWDSARGLAVQAHRAFADRVLVGWDIALLADGPCVVEGNIGPDVDIMQRMSGRGLGEGRLAELMAFHLRANA